MFRKDMQRQTINAAMQDEANPDVGGSKRTPRSPARVLCKF
jgi:hypothetical protein